MERIAEQDLRVNVLSRERAELDMQRRELLDRAGEVFTQAGRLTPNSLQQIGHCSSPFEVTETPAGIVFGKAPDDPVEFWLPGIVLPARKFIHPETQAVVDRSVLATIGVVYERPKARGIQAPLPVPVLSPDQVRLGMHPIVAGIGKYDSRRDMHYEQTISGDLVGVYDWGSANDPRAWKNAASHENSAYRFPFTAWQDEKHDWGAFMEYPRESITTAMVAFHRNNAALFSANLGLIAHALEDSRLNPQYDITKMGSEQLRDII